MERIKSCRICNSKNIKEFLDLGETLSDLAIGKGPGAKPEDFSSQVQDAVGKIKENITLRRLQVMEANTNDLILDYILGKTNFTPL